MKARRNLRFVAALVFFPISIPLLIAEAVKKKRRKVFSGAFEVLKTEGVQPALKMLERYPRIVPVGSEALFEAFEASSDEGWQASTNTWLSHITPVRVTLTAGAGPRFQRIAFSEVQPVEAPGKVTVIMPAYNAGPLIRCAVSSILKQSWRNLELIVVNDKSSDDTGAILEELAQTDQRMRVLHNSVNVGPYVSKNIALSMATGDFLTGHDADDIALPDRLEKQVASLTEHGDAEAVIGHMVRLDENGLLSFASDVYSHSFDGLHRLAMISLMVRRTTFETLGFWDSVRFAADNEMIGRLKSAHGKRVKISRLLTMLCLDSEQSLTNHVEHGIRKSAAVSPIRQDYKANWQNWHRSASGKVLHRSFSNADRPFAAPEKMLVPQTDIVKLQQQYAVSLGIASAE